MRRTTRRRAGSARQRLAALEALEARTMLSADIVQELDGTLIFTGTDTPEVLKVTDLGKGTLFVEYRDDPDATPEFYRFFGVPALVVDLMEGNDRFEYFPGDDTESALGTLLVDLGDGNDTITVDLVAHEGLKEINLGIDGGGGVDEATSTINAARLLGSLTVETANLEIREIRTEMLNNKYSEHMNHDSTEGSSTSKFIVTNHCDHPTDFSIQTTYVGSDGRDVVEIAASGDGISSLTADIDTGGGGDSVNVQDNSHSWIVQRAWKISMGGGAQDSLTFEDNATLDDDTRPIRGQRSIETSGVARLSHKFTLFDRDGLPLRAAATDASSSTFFVSERSFSHYSPQKASLELDGYDYFNVLQQGFLTSDVSFAYEDSSGRFLGQATGEFGVPELRLSRIAGRVGSELSVVATGYDDSADLDLTIGEDDSVVNAALLLPFTQAAREAARSTSRFRFIGDRNSLVHEATGYDESELDLTLNGDDNAVNGIVVYDVPRDWLSRSTTRMNLNGYRNDLTFESSGYDETVVGLSVTGAATSDISTVDQIGLTDVVLNLTTAGLRENSASVPTLVKIGLTAHTVEWETGVVDVSDTAIGGVVASSFIEVPGFLVARADGSATRADKQRLIETKGFGFVEMAAAGDPADGRRELTARFEAAGFDNVGLDMDVFSGGSLTTAVHASASYEPQDPDRKLAAFRFELYVSPIDKGRIPRLSGSVVLFDQADFGVNASDGTLLSTADIQVETEDVPNLRIHIIADDGSLPPVRIAKAAEPADGHAYDSNFTYGLSAWFSTIRLNEENIAALDFQAVLPEHRINILREDEILAVVEALYSQDQMSFVAEGGSGASKTAVSIAGNDPEDPYLVAQVSSGEGGDTLDETISLDFVAVPARLNLILEGLSIESAQLAANGFREMTRLLSNITVGRDYAESIDMAADESGQQGQSLLLDAAQVEIRPGARIQSNVMAGGDIIRRTEDLMLGEGSTYDVTTRHKPVFADYRPQFYFRTTDIDTGATYRSLNVGSAGADQVIAEWDGITLRGGKFEFLNNLGDGRDRFDLVARNIHVGQGSSMSIQVDGENGRDVIRTDVKAIVDGLYEHLARGGNDADLISTIHELATTHAPGSDGPTVDIRLEGNNGNDDLVGWLVGEVDDDWITLIDGGRGGRDSCIGNFTAINCEV